MDILTIENIKLNQHFTTKESAIRAAGEVLVLAGYVEADYVDAMVQRENDVTTYMGNFIAIPHGTDEAKKYIKKSGISIIQVPNGVDFGTPEEEKMVTVLFGIAGVENEHLDILSQIAIFCSDIDNVVELASAQTAEEIVALLQEVD
ncbi:MAG: PTS sugar transporter subunit IIA [Carnobacterium sp.]|jgi:PTS system mannitol-specific IIA component|uniref:Mannitol-specific phosphotransferase enzyme IIA component n=1 Tax=Carnobacterium maltaromaticum LMA28 TaxID=1234679 RepID=K8ERS0_CARML|nr:MULTISPECIES: PTS sugar transporter subunit IIA [Carnobacterium]AOA02160.1 PTS mannitol transporter subunit IIA [Carnobacterium maltaromaticum]KRN65778.1 PTS system, mannitol-specific IIA component [Carnobacterium maltaromaticum DSM 20342]KRN72337.1 PTS system, mannitol-specific IIA component [Carnobacterium maltaromaticum]MBC9789509.1 PTS mannitol transporter subunit IIA [Carnobacterium maltaromaticum]MBC9808220.1 PTS mannitol transporter subunit IIA [Carnobacterium maltaromaticum]